MKGKPACKQTEHGIDLVPQLCKMSPLEKVRCWMLRTLCTIFTISCEFTIISKYSVCVCVCVYVSLSRVDSLRAVDYSPSGPSVHGILQARILAWVAGPFSRRSS